MTNDLETLKSFILNKDVSLVELATEIVANSLFTVDELILIYNFAREYEIESYQFFKINLVDPITDVELNKKQDLYVALCYFIGKLQEKIKTNAT